MEISEKAKKIRLMIFDVDGVLTSGFLNYTKDGIELKNFHVLDGQGMKYLKKSGVDIGIITSCKTDIIKRRMDDLGINHVYTGLTDKFKAYEELKEKLNLSDNQIGYMGDDLPDLPMLKRVEFAVTVPSAPQIIKQYSHWVTNIAAGHGAVREVCDFIMQAQGTYQAIVDTYLNR